MTTVAGIEKALASITSSIQKPDPSLAYRGEEVIEGQGFGEIGGASQAIMAATDDYGIVIRHIISRVYLHEGAAASAMARECGG